MRLALADDRTQGKCVTHTKTVQQKLLERIKDYSHF